MGTCILLIEGKSGTGKTTVAEILEEKYGLKQIKSYTTRKKRYPEENCHTFITQEEYDLINPEDMVAKTVFSGNRYCATKQQVEENDIYVIDPAGIKNFRDTYHGKKEIYVVYLIASKAVRHERMISRGDNEEKVQERLENDEKAFQDAELLANIAIDTEYFTPDEIAEHIAEIFKN